MNDLRTETVIRAGFLKLLSDLEVAGTAEPAAPVANADECVEATGATTPMDQEPPEKTVQELTWNKVLMKLTPSVPRPDLPVPYLELVKTATS